MKKSRCTYLFTFILSYMLMIVMNVTIAKTFDKGEIKFKRGSYSGTVSGSIVRGYRDQYSLMAFAGQWMKVKISSLPDNAVFQLSIYSYGTGEDVQLEGAKDGDDAKHWYGKLPTPGYSKDGKQNAVNIVVGGTRGNTSYVLTVTIRNQGGSNDLQPPYNLSIGQKLRVSVEQKWTRTKKDTIHQTLPEFVFKLIGEALEEDEIVRKAIEISRDNKSEPFQTLFLVSEEFDENDPALDLEIEDVNFDGYKDIRMVEFRPAGPNIPYLYWLFDPKTEQFFSNEAFSKITSPEVDVEKQLIKSSWRGSAAHYGTSHYKVIDNKPILVWQEEEIYLDEQQVKVTVQERVGDEMKIVSEKIRYTKRKSNQ